MLVLYLSIPNRNFGKILEGLKKNYPNAKIKLHFSNPIQLLVATILSAQCTDDQVNKVTPVLFKKYKYVADFAGADLEELQELIRSTGFFRNKAKNIINSSRIIVERFNGNIPENMEDMLVLPGVARKTANIVLTDGLNIVLGIAVDTHVLRLSKRLGLTKENNPDKIERDLMKLVPKEDWHIFAHLLQAHGRQICSAKKPNCEQCFLNKLCPSAFTFS
jgi:endonuclease-3